MTVTVSHPVAVCHKSNNCSYYNIPAGLDATYDLSVGNSREKNGVRTAESKSVPASVCFDAGFRGATAHGTTSVSDYNIRAWKCCRNSSLG